MRVDAVGASPLEVAFDHPMATIAELGAELHGLLCDVSLYRGD